MGFVVMMRNKNKDTHNKATHTHTHTHTLHRAALQQRVASSIGLSLGPDKAPTSGRQSAFQFPSMELVNGDQTDTSM